METGGWRYFPTKWPLLISGHFSPHTPHLTMITANRRNTSDTPNGRSFLVSFSPMEIYVFLFSYNKLEITFSPRITEFFI